MVNRRKHSLYEVFETEQQKIFSQWWRQEIQKIQENVSLFSDKDSKTMPNPSSKNDDKVWDSLKDNRIIVLREKWGHNYIQKC